MRNLVISVFLCSTLLYGIHSNITKQPQVEAKTTKTALSFDYESPKEKHYTKEEALKIVCKNNGLDTDYCWKDLYAIVYVESRGNCNSIGDSNQKYKSYGCFQIKTGLHNITKEQAFDFWFASDWTLKKMIREGYPKFRSWSIGAHNSKTPIHNKLYSDSVKKIVTYL